jgi:hypothetical protein
VVEYGHSDDMHEEHAAVLDAEMYNLATKTRSFMAAQQKVRVYHSTVPLLPDARVISMGSNPQAKSIEKTMEVFSLPYLFFGDRPVIIWHLEQFTYDLSFSMRVFPARQIGQVVSMRPEVLTHITNTDQCLLELEFRVRTKETLQIQGPPTPAHMPRGHCLLFVVNNDGVPGVGKFVQVR